MVRILEKMEAYAQENNIPIMQKDGIAFLLSYIQENQVKTILEIGTAIGYSAIRMAMVSPSIKVITIERDEIRYKEAIQNIKECHLESQITIYLMDAFDIQIKDTFDLVFIDAAKSQYIPFFEKFQKNVKSTGTIISDNLDFHGLVATPEENLTRNVRGLVRKLKSYITFLEENEAYDTTFIHTGDGIGITKRHET